MIYTLIWIYVISVLVAAGIAYFFEKVLGEKIKEKDWPIDVIKVIRIIALIPILNTGMAVWLLEAIIYDVFRQLTSKK